jgi:hypothetical protein
MKFCGLGQFYPVEFAQIGAAQNGVIGADATAEPTAAGKYTVRFLERLFEYLVQHEMDHKRCELIFC